MVNTKILRENTLWEKVSYISSICNAPLVWGRAYKYMTHPIVRGALHMPNIPNTLPIYINTL